MTEVNGQQSGRGGDKKPEEELEEHPESDASEEHNVGSLVFGRTRVGPPRPLPTKPSMRGKKRRVVDPNENPFPVWMDDFTTTQAAIYCHYRTPQGLRKAWYNMEVFPFGQRGGRRTLYWKRSELDRFKKGLPLTNRKAAGILMPPKMRGAEQELHEVPEGPR
jgi:hypothetical protein